MVRRTDLILQHGAQACGSRTALGSSAHIIVLALAWVLEGSTGLTGGPRISHPEEALLSRVWPVPAAEATTRTLADTRGWAGGSAAMRSPPCTPGGAGTRES